jgi:pimeloyl-ACP methyl ester carboxylesterase
MTEFIPPGSQFHALPSPLPLKRGGQLQGARVAYETWGTLAADRRNAVLIVTGLSPDAHAASHAGNPLPGWWEKMLGPGKAIDTERWFVICVNSLGSCKGSTGPASLNPDSGQPWRLDFPALSIEDIADAAVSVVKALGITQLACLIGNSMGGMTALAVLQRHPGIARSHINISGSAQALPFSIAIRSLQREAIRLDPAWNNGSYDEAVYPEAGMRIARKLGALAVSAWIQKPMTAIRSEWSSRWKATWKAMPGVSSVILTPTATCTWGAQWTGSTWANTPMAMSMRRWHSCASTRHWPSAPIPTSCSRCSNSSRLPRAWPRVAVTPALSAWIPRRAMTPSWSTSSVSAHRWPGFWLRSDPRPTAAGNLPHPPGCQSGGWRHAIARAADSAAAGMLSSRH